MKLSNNKSLFVVIAIAAAALTRLLPHPPNFTALGAIALMGGALLSSRVLSVIIPLIALFISDVILNITVYSELTSGMFYEGFYWNYLAMIGIVAIAPLLIKEVKIKNVIVASIFASILFFTVSNFGVWASMSMYPSTIEGLIMSYTAAIPFFGYQIIGDLVFSFILFFAYSQYYSSQLATKKV